MIFDARKKKTFEDLRNVAEVRDGPKVGKVAWV